MDSTRIDYNVSQENKEPQMREDVAKSLVIDRINSMRRQETHLYHYRNYLQDNPVEASNEFFEMREKICHWTYSIIDHFNLSRETVAISLDIFDRFLATRGNQCDVNFALLTSLTTLYIAIKVHEKKKIKLSTLTQLNRGEFGPQDFERMEVEILQSISWLVHPPTVVDFVCHLLKLLPRRVNSKVRSYIFKLSEYAAELAVCDPFFIDYHPSTIAFAALLNVLEYEVSFALFPATCREKFFNDLYADLKFHRGRAAIRSARDRLQETLSASGMFHHSDKENSIIDQRQLEENSMNVSQDDQMRSGAFSSSDSVGSKGSHNSLDSRGSVKSRTRRDSFDSKGSGSSRNRRFLSPRRNGSMVTPC